MSSYENKSESGSCILQEIDLPQNVESKRGQGNDDRGKSVEELKPRVPLPCLSAECDAMVEREQRMLTLPGAELSSAVPVASISEKDLHSLRLSLQVLVDLFRLFGFSGDASTSLAGTLKTWSEQAAHCGWLKWTKYKLAAFFASQTAQELPKNPVKGSSDLAHKLFGGRVGRWLDLVLSPKRCVTLEQQRNRWSLLTSILQSKKGMPRPDEAALETAIQDTVKTLTNHTEHIPRISFPMWGDRAQGDAVDRWVSFSDLQDRCRSVVKEIFSGSRFHSRDLLRPFMPSLSANYNRTRNQLGTFGHLFDLGLLRRPGDDRQTSLYEAINGDTQSSATLFVAPVFERVRGEEARTMSEEHFRLSNQDLLQQRFSTMYFKALKLAMKEGPFVEPVALPEALKVRVISKGPPLTYFCLKPLQRHMWSTLRANRAFTLIGEPVTDSLLQRVLGTNLAPGQAYLSGDYKAATDNLRKELSECVWEQYCDTCCIPLALRELGLRALTRHIFVDPETGTETSQMAGQLMGSIISFPVLCIVNAAVCSLAMTLTDYRARRHYRLDELPLLINGDDCAFLASDTCRRAWEQIALMAGLEPSVGKTYWSREFVNINSTNFVVEPEEFLVADTEDLTMGQPVDFLTSDPHTATLYRLSHELSKRRAAAHVETHLTLHQVGYVNLGLLLGLKRSGGRAAAFDVDEDMGSRQAELLSLAADCVDPVSLHRRFLAENESQLDFFRKHHIPFYVPKQYGGLGLTPVGDYQPSRLDKRIVRAMVLSATIRDPSGHRLTSLTPLQLLAGSSEVREMGRRGPQPVVLKEAAMVHLHQLSTQVLSSSGLPLSGHWTLDLMERDPLELGQFYLWVLMMYPEFAVNANPEVQLLHSIQHNANCWRWYQRRVASLPPPFAVLRQRRFLHDLVLEWS
jgi:hypothetical protein